MRDNTMNLKTDIKNIQKSLIKKASIYENFGDKEIHELKEKWEYQNLIYGSPEQKLKAKLIDNFINWCISYTI